MLTVTFMGFGNGMRTFFYSVKQSDCDSDCRWQTCPQRYLAKLRTTSGLRNIRPIYGEVAYFYQPFDTTPRNGDIVVLYAQNTEEIDFIIAAREGLDGLKKILVMADPTGVDGDRYHKLAPRFITQAERNIDELEAVVLKMKGYIH